MVAGADTVNWRSKHHDRVSLQAGQQIADIETASRCRLISSAGSRDSLTRIHASRENIFFALAVLVSGRAGKMSSSSDLNASSIT